MCSAIAARITSDTGMDSTAATVSTILLIEDTLGSKLFDDENWDDEAMEKELDAIANRLWKIKVKLRGEE
jgi:hypothetical protein